jgi:hypothetical protein
MKRIDEFVNSIYAHIGDKEADELKEEMRSHLFEAVEELKKEGKSENDAVSLAIERFGDEKHITRGLLSIFNKQKKLVKWLLLSALLFLILGVGNIAISSQQNALATNNLFPEIIEKYEDTIEFNTQNKQELQQYINKNNEFFDSIGYFSLKKIPEEFQNTDKELYSAQLEKVFEYGETNGIVFEKEIGQKWVILFQYQDGESLSEILTPTLLGISAVLFLVWLVIYIFQRKQLRTIYRAN